MILWGVFEKRSAVHVCPCDGHGDVDRPHELSVQCQCDPEIEWYPTRPILIHKAVESP